MLWDWTRLSRQLKPDTRCTRLQDLSPWTTSGPMRRRISLRRSGKTWRRSSNFLCTAILCGDLLGEGMRRGLPSFLGNEIHMYRSKSWRVILLLPYGKKFKTYWDQHGTPIGSGIFCARKSDMWGYIFNVVSPLNCSSVRITNPVLHGGYPHSPLQASMVWPWTTYYTRTQIKGGTFNCPPIGSSITRCARFQSAFSYGRS